MKESTHRSSQQVLIFPPFRDLIHVCIAVERELKSCRAVDKIK